MLIIRQYQPTDKGSVRELHIQALEPTGAMLPGGLWNDDDLSDITNQYLTNGGEFLAGVLDNRIVCMGALKKKSDTTGEIKRMRVLPDFQRKGYGQLMLHRLETKARTLGYTELYLDTTTKQIPAQNFYKKNGYCEISRTVFAGLEIIFFEKHFA
jgi:GNAT superfamily N-acetyltransferase